MEGTPGLLSIESFRDVAALRLAAGGRRKSPEAAAEGMPRLLAVGGRRDEWSQAPDDVLPLAAA